MTRTHRRPCHEEPSGLPATHGPRFRVDAGDVPWCPYRGYDANRTGGASTVVCPESMNISVLYVSGSLGLGHVVRDLAVAREMRRMCPEMDIAWIAGTPASDVL